MKSKFRLKAIITALLICLTSGLMSDNSAACAQSYSTTRTSALSDVFKNALGQYPYEVNLLKNNVLKKRIITLIGQKRYDFLLENFQVETPVEFSNFVYHTFACRAHNCGTTEFEISYNPKTDNLCVRYRVDDTEKIFKEKEGNASWDY